MHFSNVLWSPDNNYQSEVSGLLQMADASVKQVGQTIIYIDKVKQTHISSSKTINNIVESSYTNNNNGFNNNDMIGANPLLINSPTIGSGQSASLIQQKLGAAAKGSASEPKVRSLAANYELHLDHLSDVAFSRESLASQIDTKILKEITEFRDQYQAFYRAANKELSGYLNDYNKLLKACKNNQNDYNTKCKSLEEIYDEVASIGTKSATLGESPLRNSNTLKPTQPFHKRNFSSSSARSSIHGSPKNNNLLASPFQAITKTISNVMSRQNSDDENSDDEDEDDENDSQANDSGSGEEFNDDPDNFLERLIFPMKIGASTFKTLNDLQVFLSKIIKDAENLPRNQEAVTFKVSLGGVFGNNNAQQSLNNEKPVTISNHEVGNWLKMNRTRTENSIKNIELFGQTLVNKELLKLAAFKNSIFNSFNNRFQVTNDNQVVVYEFTKFAKFIVNFDLEKHNVLKQQKAQHNLQKKLRYEELRSVKREKKLWEEKNKKAHSRIPSTESNDIAPNSVPGYVSELRQDDIRTPKNRSRANTGSLQPVMPNSASTNAISNYLSNQFKSLTTASSPEAIMKKKETLKQNIITAEEAYKKGVRDLNIAKKDFELSFSNFVVSFEDFEKKKSQLIVNSLNYLSFLLMKQSEYENKKFQKLHVMISESNNHKATELEISNLLKSRSLYYYSPSTSFKFERNEVSLGFLQNKSLISNTSLYGSDVSLLPHCNDLTNLSTFSVPIFLNEYLSQIFQSFLKNVDDKLNIDAAASPTKPDDKDSTNEDPSRLLELGNYARNSWIQPFNIMEAYAIRQQLIDLYDDQQEILANILLEAKNSELNALSGNGKSILQFQSEVLKDCLGHVFAHNTLTATISALKLWLLELPDSLISFVVFEKIRALYVNTYSDILKMGYDNIEAEFGHLKYDLKPDGSRFDTLVKLLSHIPRSNLSSLHLILKHLYVVSSLGFQDAESAQVETYKLLQDKFINDIINPVGTEHNSIPLAHLLLRPSNKNKLKTTQPVNTTPSIFGSAPSTPSLGGNINNAELKPSNYEFQFFIKNVMKDLLTPTVLQQLESLVIERENQQQKSLKLKSIKEKEAIRSLSSNNSPGLSRNNVKALGNSGLNQTSGTNTRRSSSSAASGSQGPNSIGSNNNRLGTHSTTSGPLSIIQTSVAPTIMVEGLALRSFGTKNRNGSTEDKKQTGSQSRGAPATSGDSNSSHSEPSEAKGSSTQPSTRPNSLNLGPPDKAVRKRSFSLLNSTRNSGIKIIPSRENSPEGSPKPN